VPKRTTPLQMIVHFVRQHFAASDVTVTESKMQRDAGTGRLTEVDVVIEGNFDGDPAVTSIEVTEQDRPVDVTWAQRIIKKHERLPTTRLILVSQAGFTSGALRAIAAEGGHVLAFQPQIQVVDGEPVIKRLYVDSVKLTPTRFKIGVVGPDGLIEVPGRLDINVYSATGEYVGPLAALVNETINLRWVARWFGVMAHNHPERSDLTGFAANIVVMDADYYLQKADDQNVYRIGALVIEGAFRFHQDEIPLTITDLGGRIFGAAETSFIGRPTVWVGTTNTTAQETKLSWRTTDNKPLIDDPPRLTNLFLNLLQISPPQEVQQLIADVSSHM
jgi:hypothetical protein